MIARLKATQTCLSHSITKFLMGEWFDNQKQSISGISDLLKERIEKVNRGRELTAEETKHLNKLEGIAEKLKRRENVQTRQLQTCLLK